MCVVGSTYIVLLLSSVVSHPLTDHIQSHIALRNVDYILVLNSN